MMRSFSFLVRFVAIAPLVLATTGCTDSFDVATNAGQAVLQSVGLISNSGDVVMEKTQGLNVGESEAVWAAGLKRVVNNTLPIKIHRISLDPLLGYPKTTWTMNLTNPEIVACASTGTRTMVTEWGLLVGRGCTTAGLYLVDPVNGPLPNPIVELPGSPDGSRVTPIAYLTKRNGVVRKFIGMAIQRMGDKVFRIERFMRDDASNSFIRLKPYEFAAPSMPALGGVYKGFTLPCSVFDPETCVPIFFGGGAGSVPNTFGVKLDTDILAPTPCPVSSCTATLSPVTVMPPNDSFVSASHPKSGGAFGSINDAVYSFAGDPDTGEVYKATTDGTSHMSYDRINQLVYQIADGSSINSDGTRCTPFPACSHSVVTVFRKECFTTQTNCSPLTTDRSRIFTDVGPKLGPTSDLQNGCVAILSYTGPGSTDGADFVADVYKACVRDPADLNKGISIIKIAEAEGATYMYNDFTGATQGDHAQYVLFDFTARGITSIKNVRLEWTPKPGFTNTPVGLDNGVRCYTKGQKNPPAFTPIPFGQAFTPQLIPGCGGANINQVEFEMKIVPKTRFTRLQSLSVRTSR